MKSIKKSLLQPWKKKISIKIKPLLNKEKTVKNYMLLTVGNLIALENKEKMEKKIKLKVMVQVTLSGNLLYCIMPQELLPLLQNPMLHYIHWTEKHLIILLKLPLLKKGKNMNNF